MGQPAIKTATKSTYEDIVSLPEGMVGEIIGGELYAQPRPAPPHAWSNTRLSTLIDGPFGIGIGGPGGWVILAEPEIQFGQDTLVPDIAGWRRQRLRQLPREGPLTTTPDWVCEVLSPGTERTDRLRKLRIYATHRVAHVWLLNPWLHTLDVFRWQEGDYLVANVCSGDEPVRVEPFDAVELPLQHLWGPVVGEGQGI